VGINNWQIITSQRDGELKVFSGSKNLPPQIDWVLEREEEYIPKFDEPVKYKLEVTDNDNKVWESKTQELPISQITLQKKMEDLTLADKEISKFSFISFDFNSSELTREHKTIVELVKKMMKKNSTVRIEGYTDRTGDPNRNKTLSEKRALSVAKALGLSQNTAKGMGPTLIFDNDLPEGRFFNRTVNVTVETPVELK
jgi:outer membrane protein OmpA-like peptidoglycan-associated protein